MKRTPPRSRATPKLVAIDAALLRRWALPEPNPQDGKEERGTVLVIGGCREMPGAIQLAAEAALRAGAGKLQVATAEDVAGVVAAAIPEARVIALATDRAGHVKRANAALLEAAAKADAILIGPGMRTDTATRVAAQVAAVARGTLVLDAGAVTTAAVRSATARAGDASVIVTPHAGEMAALVDRARDEIERDAAAIARDTALQLDIVVALKGPTTHVADRDGLGYVHRGGCAGLGTSGSGDVLAGVVTGFTARGATAAQAAAWGVYVHGAAGTRLAREIGEVGFLARELCAVVPRVLNSLAGKRRR